MGVTGYTKFTSLVTARDLQSDLGLSLDGGITAGEALSRLYEVGGAPETSKSLEIARVLRGLHGVAHEQLLSMFPAAYSLVLEKQRPVGWTSALTLALELELRFPGLDLADITEWKGLSTLSPAPSVRELMHPLVVDSVVSASTSAFCLVRLLKDRQADRLFVLEGEEIVGTVDYSDFDSPLFGMALFSLILQVEKAVLTLVQEDAEASWAVLAPRWKRKARPLLADKKWAVTLDRFYQGTDLQRLSAAHRETPASFLLEYTSLKDKKIIVLERKLLPEFETTDLKIFFTTAENVRNAIAHVQEWRRPILSNVNVLNDFVDNCHLILQQVLRRIGRHQP